MHYDTDKVYDAVLALLALTVHREDEYGARAWKGHDWDALDRLHEKELVSDPVSKAKSVILTPEGLARGRMLFEQLFPDALQGTASLEPFGSKRTGPCFKLHRYS